MKQDTVKKSSSHYFVLIHVFLFCRWLKLGEMRWHVVSVWRLVDISPDLELYHVDISSVNRVYNLISRVIRLSNVLNAGM